MSDPTQEKYTSPNPSGSDDGQIPVEEEGRGVELSNWLAHNAHVLKFLDPECKYIESG